MYRPRRIIERQCDASSTGKRGSARGQMQKFAAGKFHGDALRVRATSQTQLYPTPARMSPVGTKRTFRGWSQCRLSGARTSARLSEMSASDPKRTLASPRKGRFLDRPYERTVSPFTFSGSDFETGPLMCVVAIGVLFNFRP